MFEAWLAMKKEDKYSTGLKRKNINRLQEAHCTESTETFSEVWAAEWGYTALFSSLASNKGSVAILFNNNFSF